MEYLESTATDAFENLDQILDTVEQKNLGENSLIILSLGPAATILAFEFAQRGIQALDIGHISNSFSNIFEGGKWPESRPTIK
ncbi:GT-D fold domain-containing glycosyltransferase [Corynebacterium sp. HMSC034E11]|uniref:GT-D fold domain-containing glycosyltransferase n=1 Tax=Corynebacterium sp. HMSC034E11 TaxID=1715169 RepID=UPI00352B0139